MLHVENLTKVYPAPSGPHVLFRDLSFSLARSDRLAILGRNGQGKSTLIKILGGVVAPTEGEVRWDMNPSWPLGFGGGFQGGCTGLDNIRFLARLYNRPFDDIIAPVEAFAELGDALEMPVKYYSSGMRARLAFGLSLAIEFDCYLIDEVIAVGDATFRRKCERELFQDRAERAFVIASHDLAFIKQTCRRAIIIERGMTKQFDDIDLAIDVYVSLCEEEQTFAGEDHLQSKAARA